ncbi:NUDIX domain-containing protein [Streptomyces sp. AC1-42T]|uniref:NUDIX domain-containing protein n=1 Tax=Streptomyces sp. AC1-42T TaxID=2218665 RepID=UPI000DAD0A30|nr:NUDIX hydrolase [Streptomyces sp. AC1-42T]PZT71580.1 NUDIX hydrolase [Streptomyces sp. AC1-42T]
MTDTKPETIRYTADVALVTDDGRIALVERRWDPFEGDHALPGGHVDEKETSRMAASRELFEEAGVQVPPADLVQLGVFDEPGRDPRGRYVTVLYLARVPDGTVLTAGDDARTATWWPLTSLPPLAFDHAEILEAVADQIA